MAATPVSPARRAWDRPWLRRLAPVAVFVVATALAWSRMSEVYRATMWAEDAQVFSARALDAAQLPWWIFTPYDGYMHALPQGIAIALWGVVPIDAMAVAFAAAACVVAGAVAGLVYALTASWTIGLPARLLLAATTVLVPGLTYEVLGNLANVHWFLLWLAPFLFLAQPRAWWSAALLGLLAFVVLTTEVQAVLFLPLLLWRFRDRRRWLIAGGAALGAVVQAVAVLGGGRAPNEGRPSILSVVNGYVMQVPLLGLAGTGEGASAIVAYSGWIAAYIALVPFALCAGYVAVGEPRRRNLLVVAGVLTASFVIWTGGYALSRSSGVMFSTADRATLLEGIPLLRYAIVPLMLLFLVVALAAGRASAAGVRSVTVAILVLSAALFVAHFRPDVDVPREEGPTWAAGLEQARAECARDGAVTAPVRVAPLYGTWIVPMPCENLR